MDATRSPVQLLAKQARLQVFGVLAAGHDALPILAEGAIALSVTLSGGALFAS